MEKHSVHDDKVVIMRQEAPKLAISEEKLHMRKYENEMKQSMPQTISIGKSNSQNILSNQSKLLIAESGPGRPTRYTSEQQICTEMKTKWQQDTATIQRKMPTILQEVSSSGH